MQANPNSQSLSVWQLPSPPAQMPPQRLPQPSDKSSPQALSAQEGMQAHRPQGETMDPQFASGSVSQMMGQQTSGELVMNR